jgi:hypothetical protein
MHPGFHGWWRARQCGMPEMGNELHGAAAEHRHGPWGPGFHGDPRGFHRGHHGPWAGPSFDDGGVLGVRRPLRFLAHKLELSEAQVAAFAAILDELKTERAQAAVDQRRRTSALAETLESVTFDEQRIATIGDDQRQSDEKIHAAVARALKKMHGALDDEQRKRLAYLLRTGALTM